MKNIFKTIGYIVLYLVIYFVYQTKFLIYALIGAMIFGHKFTESSIQSYMMSAAVPVIFPAAVVSLIFYWLLLRGRKINMFEYCRFKKVKPLNILLIIMIAIGLSVIIAIFVNFAIKYIPQYKEISDMFSNSTSNPLSVLCLVLVGPVIEEIIFRGIIFNDLRAHVNVAAAVIIQAFVFGLYHMNLMQGIYAGVIGLVFGVIYVWTKSIFASMTAHITFNILGSGALDILLQNVQVSTPMLTIIAFILSAVCMILLFRSTHSKASKVLE